MAEVSFKVGDSGNYRDGDVLIFAPTGILLSPAEITAWFASGTTPAAWSTIPAYKQRRVRRRLLITKWLTEHSPAEIVAEGFHVDLAGAVKLKASAQADRDDYLLVGYDTNWGREDLKVHGAVRVDGITADHVFELLECDEAESHRPNQIGKRRWRIRYRNYLGAGVIANLEDKEARVEAIRSVSAPLAAFHDDPRP